MARPLKIMSNVLQVQFPAGVGAYPCDAWEMSDDETRITIAEGDERTTYPASAVAVLQLTESDAVFIVVAPSVSEKIAGVESVAPLKHGTLFETVHGPCYVPAAWANGVAIKGEPEFLATPQGAPSETAPETETETETAPKLTRRAPRR